MSSAGAAQPGYSHDEELNEMFSISDSDIRQDCSEPDEHGGQYAEEVCTRAGID